MHETAAATLKLANFNEPRLEPHYTFRIASDIEEKVDDFSIQSKIAEMRTSVEVSSSRYDYPVENTEDELANYIADHCRAGQLFIGERGSWMDNDMSSIEACIYVNRKLTQETGHTDEENPLRTLIKFINTAVANKIPIKQ